jgi:hypothetical protein
VSETVTFGRRPRPWWGWLAGAVAIVLLVAGWILSERRGDREQAALTGCARSAVAAVDEVETRLAALANYIAPAVDSSSRRTYEDLYSMLSDDAVSHRPTVEEALDGCRSVAVWWVHRGQAARRTAYVTFLEAELARLDEIAEDGTTFQAGYDEIIRLRLAAESD